MFKTITTHESEVDITTHESEVDITTHESEVDIITHECEVDFMINKREKKVKKNLLGVWEDKKRMNKDVAKMLAEVGKKSRSIRMMECSEFLQMQECPKCKEKHVAKASLCRDRLCPICQWRLCRKRAFEMLRCLDYIAETGVAYKYQFLTLTQKNIPSYKLRDELKRMSKAWNRIICSDNLTRASGYARVTEITYNAKDKSFHPHQHIIIAWKEEDKPFKRTEWENKWQKAMNLDYKPLCRLRYIKPQKEDAKATKAVLETYKYTVKTSDLLKMPSETFKIFVDEINGMRSCSYTGIFKEARKALKLKNTEIQDIDEEEEECRNCGAEMVNFVLRWSFADERYKKIMEERRNQP